MSNYLCDYCGLDCGDASGHHESAPLCIAALRDALFASSHLRREQQARIVELTEKLVASEAKLVNCANAMIETGAIEQGDDRVRTPAQWIVELAGRLAVAEADLDAVREMLARATDTLREAAPVSWAAGNPEHVMRAAADWERKAVAVLAYIAGPPPSETNWGIWCSAPESGWLRDGSTVCTMSRADAEVFARDHGPTGWKYEARELPREGTK